MHIIILTHPFYGNYGGMLQAFALQKALASKELPSLICRYYSYPVISFPKRMACVLNDWVQMGIKFFSPHWGRKHIPQRYFFELGKNFLNRCVKSVPYKYALKSDGAWIVGSDQVWRSSYVSHWGGLPFFFLAHLPREIREKSIAYSASFGTDEWEASQDDIATCASLAREFKAISVREQSGVGICHNQLGVAAVQIADPTLLPETEVYHDLIRKERTWKPEVDYTAAYILDRTADKEALIQECKELLNTEIQHLTPNVFAKRLRDRRPISVSQWLRLIRDSKFFITDYFHGCVFAIIFNKPFVCLGNKGRGNARFDSLLRTFGLQERLLTELHPQKIQELLNVPIDWDKVNAIRLNEQQRSFDFILTNLKKV